MPGMLGEVGKLVTSACGHWDLSAGRSPSRGWGCHSVKPSSCPEDPAQAIPSLLGPRARPFELSRPGASVFKGEVSAAWCGKWSQEDRRE